MDRVNINATFANDDIFERKKYAEIIMKLANKYTSEKGACSIAIDAPWGIGKSTFLHMFRNEIELCCSASPEAPLPGYSAAFSNEHRLCVYYNAWEHDDSPDAFSPIFWSIVSILDPKGTTNEKKRSWLNDLFKHMGTLASAGTAMAMNSCGSIIANQTGNVVKSLFDIATQAESTGSYDSLFKELQRIRTIRDTFHDAIAAFASDAGKLFILVDELDRCKPTFAIDTLETIKHYFDIPNVVFIFAVDLIQLSHAIGGRYGGKIDAGGYLTKFFDHHLRLNTPTAKQMIHIVDNKYNMSARQEEDIEHIFHACGITPREVQRIYSNTKTLIETLDTFDWTYQEKAYVSVIIILFLSIKHRKPDIYSMFTSAKANWDLENWKVSYPTIYDFLHALASYRSLMSNQAYDRFEALQKQRASSNSLDNGMLQVVGRFGLSILETRNGYYSKTFIQLLQDWLESVAT